VWRWHSIAVPIFDTGIAPIIAFDAEFKEEQHKRDEEGKFAEQEGGGAGAEPDAWKGDRPTNPVRAKGDLYQDHAAREQFVNDLAKQYGVKPVRVFVDDEMLEHFKDRPDQIPIAAQSYQGIGLNPDFWNNPEKLKASDAQRAGMFVASDAESVLTHEFGHYLDKEFTRSMPPGIEVRSRRSSFYNKWADAKWAIIKKYHDNWEQASPSLYADEDPDEYVAEAFAAMHKNHTIDVSDYAPQNIKDRYVTRGLEASKELWKELYQWREDMLSEAGELLAKQRRKAERQAKQTRQAA
jgi:hypothetical protein